ncbi:MAG: response regulator [Oligoflexia bacterium]|nr:response regulator [Oligoflexia bacterium]
MEATNQSNFKVLIADDDGAGSRRLMDFLKERGFSVEHVLNGTVAKEKIKEWVPHFVICDLTLAEFNAPQLLNWIKQEPVVKDNRPKVFVTSAHNVVRNIKECISLGASDYIVKPFKHEDILTRLVFHIQNKREVGSGEKASGTGVKLEGADVYLHLLDLVLKEALSSRPREEMLLNFTKMIAIALKAVRCSAVMITEDLQEGLVLASSDNRDARGFKLDMNKYPEMLHVMNTEKLIVIEDLAYDPQLAKIKDLVKGISFNSMIVAPLRSNGEMYGIISARMAKEHSKFNDRDIRFVSLVAQVASLILTTGLSLPHEFLLKKTAS